MPEEVTIPTPILKDIDSLKENKHNVKQHPEEQVLRLVKVMQFEKKFVNPLLIDEKDNILAGHGRILAARKLNMKQVPCVVLDGLTQSEKDAIMIMDNEAGVSPWNEENLSFILNRTKFDFAKVDMDFKEFKLGDPKEETDEIPEPPAEPKSKLGEIYQLGRHRIMCGDATKDLDKLLEDKEIDLLLTDPPYGISVVQGGGISGDGYGFNSNSEESSMLNGKMIHRRLYRKIIGDDKPFDPTFLLTLSKQQILFGANHYTDKLPKRSHWLVWDKKQGDQEVYTDNFSDAELAWTSVSDKVSVKTYRHTWNGMTRQGNRDEELKDRVHPTQKPVGLLSNILKDYSNKDNFILDCYLGSGSTLIACEQTNRICYGMEIDPGYIDVIILRWENFTGKKAVKIVP